MQTVAQVAEKIVSIAANRYQHQQATTRSCEVSVARTNNTSVKASSSTSRLTPQIEYGLLRLEANFGYLWKAQWGGDPRVIAAGRLQWAAAMDGLKPADIDRGLACIAKHKKSVPTPAEFRELCLPTPADIGWPEPEAAYKIALRAGYRMTKQEDWMHDAVYHAWRKIDSDIWQNCTSERARQYFFKAYRDTLEFAHQGGILATAPVAVLPAPQETIEQREQRLQARKQALEKIKKISEQSALQNKLKKDAEKAELKKAREEHAQIRKEAEAAWNDGRGRLCG